MAAGGCIATGGDGAVHGRHVVIISSILSLYGCLSVGRHAAPIQNALGGGGL